MTRFLASVRTVAEARLVMAEGADIVDIKNPAHGALGAVDNKTTRDIVRAVNGDYLTSATIGDIPLQPQQVSDAIDTKAATGVDIIKVGLFAETLSSEMLTVFSDKTRQGIAIVLVCFADDGGYWPDCNTLRAAGLQGVMLDTRNKSAGTLRHVMPVTELERFITGTRESGLLNGLAGSLLAVDIAALLELTPDYLGFRGALCRRHRRVLAVDQNAVRQIRSLIPLEHTAAADLAVSLGG